MTEQYKMGWTDPRIMSMVELFADYVATKAQVHKPWVELTDKEINSVMETSKNLEGSLVLPYGYARDIEAKLKEKNNG